MSSDVGKTPKEYIGEKIKRGAICSDDGALLLRFVNEIEAEKGLTAHTTASYVRYLWKAIEHIPSVRSWKYQTITQFASIVRTEYKPNTSRKHIMIIKVFCTWLIENRIITDITNEQLRKIKPGAADRMTKQADDMITDDEFKRILDGTKNSRDRAVISVLFESALRPFELLDLKWGDVKTDQYGAVLNTAGKTGKPRYIRLIHSASYLKVWKNDYPEKIDRDSPVFVNLEKAPHHAMTRGALKKIINKSVSASGIEDKRIHAYLFRHSRITQMLAQAIPESVIKLQAWGGLSTPMIATYGHLTNDQQDMMLLKAAGIDTGVKTANSSNPLKPVKCPGCGEITPAGLKYCPKCGSIMDPEEYQKKVSFEQMITELYQKYQEEKRQTATAGH